MAQTKNICQTNDVFARYKRDIIQIKHEHKHGGKTKLLNLDVIAKQIHLPLKTLQRVLQKKLSVALQNNTLSGQWTVEQIELAIDQIIAKRVLCKQCGLPELNRKNVCNACGFGSTSNNEENGDEMKTPSEFDMEFKRLYELLLVSKPELIDTLWKCETMEQLHLLHI